MTSPFSSLFKKNFAFLDELNSTKASTIFLSFFFHRLTDELTKERNNIFESCWGNFDECNAISPFSPNFFQPEKLSGIQVGRVSSRECCIQSRIFPDISYLFQDLHVHAGGAKSASDINPSRIGIAKHSQKKSGGLYAFYPLEGFRRRC